MGEGGRGAGGALRAGGEEEEGGRGQEGEGSFWFFECLVVVALVPSVIGLRKRQQYVLALHNRRLDRMINS